MPGKKHTHKYYMGIVAGTNVWICAFGDCSHYMPKHMESMVPGRNSICWDCGHEFSLDEIAMERMKPICKDCDGRTELERSVSVNLSSVNEHMPEALRKLLEYEEKKKNTPQDGSVI